jgi:hypothetical protein
MAWERAAVSVIPTPPIHSLASIDHHITYTLLWASC